VKRWWGVFLLALQVGWASDAWRDKLAEGQTFFNSGQYVAAEAEFREALAEAERTHVEARHLIVLHNALAGSSAEAGHFTEAEREYKLAMAVVAKTEGTDALHYAVLLASLATLPTLANERHAMIRALREAVAAHEGSGPSAELAGVRGCLASLLRGQGEEGEQETLLLQSLADLKKDKMAAGHLVARFLNDLAVLRLDQRRYDESIELQLQSIGLLVKELGGEHPSLVIPYNNLATTYANVKRYDEAEAAFERAIAVCKKTLGEEHLSYGVLLENYAVVLKKAGRKREAKEMETQGQQIERAAERHNGVGAKISVTALLSRQ
jgi:tetratricopeptide (TPR) repeat protein